MSITDQLSDSGSDASEKGEKLSAFQSTPWSEVLAAGDSQNANNRHSLEKLCRLYWPPLHAFVWRKVRDTHLAQDLTQSFFERLLSGRTLRLADPARGRFRSFLINAIEWHLTNEFRESRAIKRGGKIKIFSLDFSSASIDPTDDGMLSAEELFEREWALTLLTQTMARLEAEQVASNKKSLFDALKSYLTGSERTDRYAEASRMLEMSESAARMAVSRLRRRYRELLREEIHRTVASSQDVEDEIRHLFRAVSK